MASPLAVGVRRRLEQGRVEACDVVRALGQGPWLVISPHDDDVVIGMGMTVRAARAAGIEVHVAVATDGSLGYVHEHERAGLVNTRARELAAAAALLDVPAVHVHMLGFPDGSLIAHQGCRGPDERETLPQRLVSLLRQVRPSTVFVCTPSDVHPDHRVCARESEIACVWAAGKIWLERGEPIAPPRRFHYAVYAPFEGDPDLEVQGGEAAFAAKLDALRAFPSQGVVEPMIERLSADGPYEYFKEARQLAYHPSRYRALFGA